MIRRIRLRRVSAWATAVAVGLVTLALPAEGYGADGITRSVEDRAPDVPSLEGTPEPVGDESPSYIPPTPTEEPSTEDSSTENDADVPSGELGGDEQPADRDPGDEGSTPEAEDQSADSAPDTEAPTESTDPAEVSLDAPVKIDEIPLERDEELEEAVVESPDSDATPFAEDGTPAPVDPIFSAQGSPQGVTVVGVTWPVGALGDSPELQIRTRAGESWSSWQELHAEGGVDESGAAAGQRDGTEPFLAGEIDEVEVALAAQASDAHDVRLVVLGQDPDGAPVATETLDAPRSRAAAKPTIYTRAQWGANESLMTWKPQTGRVRAAVVHHTVGTNSYTKEQVPSLIRNIYTYHAVSRGWGDIGYNFLIDKFGRAWEGRSGGMDRPIIAAHATGVNSETMGVSFMGNYDTAAVPDIMIEASALVIAWKFSIHGVNPVVMANINGVSRPTVFGHRDVGQTACPGRYLYARLDELRRRVHAVHRPAPVPPPPAPAPVIRPYTRDLNGDGHPDLALRSSASVALGATKGAGWATPTVSGTGWPTRVHAAGDVDQDGYPDTYTIDAGGTLRLYFGAANNGWRGATVLGGGWNGFDLFAAGVDWTGDGVPDILARNSTDKSIYLFRGATGSLGTGEKIGSGWGSMNAISFLGTLDNGKPALLARTDAGVLKLYGGTGQGTFAGTATTVGTGWQGMTALIGAGDFNGDGKADIVARDGAGRLLLYPGDGKGGVLGTSVLGTGWQGFTTVVPVLRSGHGQDLYVRAQDGRLIRYSHGGFARFDTVSATAISGAGVVETIAPGDWNGDGKADLMTRRSNGQLALHAGTGNGTYAAAGTVIGTGWQIMDQVIGVGDWPGSTGPALVALRRSTGAILLYASNGKGGFEKAFTLATGAQNVDRVIAGGKWASGSYSDLLTRDSRTGDLQLRRGQSNGLLGAPVVVGTGWQVMTSIVGTGDLDGDGKPDLVAAHQNGSLLLYSGNGQGRFFGARQLQAWPKSYTIS